MVEKNIYFEHAKEIKDICVKEDVDVGVATAMWEMENQDKKLKAEDRLDFLRACNQTSLNEIIGE